MTEIETSMSMQRNERTRPNSDVAFAPKGGTGASPNTVSLALFDRTTGVSPVMEDSASRLSAHETTGWKPVVHDRQDACPPARLIVLDGPAVGQCAAKSKRNAWLPLSRPAKLAESLFRTQCSTSKEPLQGIQLARNFGMIEVER